MKKSLFFVSLFAVLASWAAPTIIAAGQGGDDRYVPVTDPLVLEKLERWQDLKFGLLMHWGPYSQWGVVESWSICPEDEDWCRRDPDDYALYLKKYQDLKLTFEPVHFSPEEWAGAAREAGMRYVVFTTKHHDGFTMFDSKLTDYKITSAECPFHSDPRADVTGKIFEAFRKENFMIGAYFSKPDWHSPYYWWPKFPPRDRNVNYDPAAYPEQWEKFVEYTHGQILELMSGYGRIDILWLDGGWVAAATHETIAAAYRDRLNGSATGFLKAQIISQDIRMDELAAKCRAKQPGLIVVDRAVPGPNQNYLTPENTVPEKALPYPWESCIVSGGGWSYTRDAKYMSGREGIRMLADIVSKGGNLLLNIAPGPDGTWQAGAYSLLNEYAAWMRINSNAIYGTRAVPPYGEGDLRYTRGKDGALNAILLAGDDGVLPQVIRIPSFRPAPGASVAMLGAKGELAWRQTEKGCEIMIPDRVRKSPPCRHAWVIRMSAI